ncbi:MAG: FAD binding domain-containing protein [Chloracidobacterium sp.]|nr:FAD binding domain-containing protein [Chloracidobacterium sp.]
MTTLLAPFQYKQPKTLDQVFHLVRQLQSEGRTFIFSGGGTDVISLLKHQLSDPQTVISLSELHSLKQIKMLSADRIQIGALTSLASLMHDSKVQELVPALAAAVGRVASPQIRNQATIGGNILVTNRCIFFNQSELNRESHSACFKAKGEICHLVKSAKRGRLPLCQARFVSDTVPVLLLLDAELVLVGPERERRIAAKDLFLPDGIDCKNIQGDEILLFVEIDVSSERRIHYEKLTVRDTQDFPSLGIAVGIEVTDEEINDENACLSVAMTGINTRPELMEFRFKDYGSYGEMVNEACHQANKKALTFQQDLFPRGYRKKLVEVYIRRAVKQLTGDLWI